MTRFVPAVLLVFAGMSYAQPSIFGIRPTPNPDAIGDALSAVAEISSSDVWAVGYQHANSNYNDGAMTLTEHFDGVSWSVVPSPNPNPANCIDPLWALNAVAGVGSSDVWAVGFKNVDGNCTTEFNPLILHWDGAAWKAVANPALSKNGNAVLNGVVAFATNNVYAMGYQSGPRSATYALVEHWDGTKWSVVTTPNANNFGNYLNAGAGTNPSDIWAVGDKVAPNVPVLTLAEHFDGRAWVVVPTPNPSTTSNLDQNVLSAVAAVSPNDVTAVGYVLNTNSQNRLTLIEHWNGKAWSVAPSPNVSSAPGAQNAFTSTAAISGSNIYAFGYFADSATSGQPQTLAAHYDGISWTIVPAPTRGVAQQLFGAFASPANNQVWSVGGFSTAGYDTEFGFLQVPKTLAIQSSKP